MIRRLAVLVLALLPSLAGAQAIRYTPPTVNEIASYSVNCVPKATSSTGLACGQLVDNGTSVSPATTGVTPLGTTSKRFSAAYLGGATLTASTPAIDIATTWNNAGVTFIGATIAATETASAATSRYFQILGGAAGTTDEFYVLKGGHGYFAGSVQAVTSIMSGTTITAGTHLIATADVRAGASAAFEFVGRSAWRSPSDGVLTLYNNANTDFTDLYFGPNAGDATPTATTIHGARSRGGTDSNVAGASVTLEGGLGTGTGGGGDVVLTAALAGASGTTANTATSRYYIRAAAKALTAGAATPLFRVALAQGSVVSFKVIYSVQADDATDFQVRGQTTQVTCANKGGTETCTVSTAIGSVCTDTVAPGDCSVNTLTATATATSNSANTIDFEINAASSLTETTLNAVYTVERTHGTGSITPQ